MKTVVGLYDDLAEARRVVEDLVDEGFARNDVSLVARDYDSSYATQLDNDDVADDAMDGTASGAVAGGVLGGLAGLLVGLGALAIPGVGPVIAAGPIAAALAGAGIGAVAGGLLGALVDWGVPEEQANYYAEGVRRGGTLVAVKTAESQVEEVVAVMNQHDPVNVERRSEYWRQSGWESHDPQAEPYTADKYQSERQNYQAYNEDDYYTYAPTFRTHYQTNYANTARTYEQYEPGYRYGYQLATDERYSDYDNWDAMESEARQEWEQVEDNADNAWDDFKDSVRHAWEEVKDAFDTDDDYQTARNIDVDNRDVTDRDAIPVVEEELRVGKREVGRGGVRVHTYIEETPVEESVELREEHVRVERRPVDRAADANELDAFKERTIEMRETAEEVVVDKQARVIEEIMIDKDVDVHTETVRDTVRHTRVDIDDIGEYDEYDEDFRTHYDSTFADKHYSYDQYQPAYRYGYSLATDSRYHDRDWNDIEPEVRTRWEDSNEGTWEEFKDAVQHGWNEVKRAVT